MVRSIGGQIMQQQTTIEKIPSPSITSDIFKQKEQNRLSLFSQTWMQKIPKVFEDIPSYYRLGNIVASLGLWELWVWQFVKIIKLRPQDKVLDVCAGTNCIGIKLLKKQSDISVTAIDRSREMQEYGKKEAAKLGFHIESIVEDVHKLPFQDNTFDVITIQAASRHLRLDVVLPEIYRVLKPGGSFYHCDMLKPSNNILKWLYLNYLRISLPLTAWVFSSSKSCCDCKDYFTEVINHFYTTEELSGVMEIVGFSPVTCKKSIWCGMVGFHRAQKPL